MTIQEFIENNNRRPRSVYRNRYHLTIDALDACIDHDIDLEDRDDFLREAGIVLSNNFTAMKMARLVFENYDFERSLERASPGVTTGLQESVKVRRA